MSRSPLVSVVIPYYNASRYIGATLRSVFAQTWQPLHVVVVDDGSTDDFESAIAPFAGRIQAIRQPNSGPAVARNRGLRASESEFVAFLDADDLWHPDKIRRQIAFLREHPECRFVHTRDADIGPAGEPLPRRRASWYARPAQGWCAAELIAHNTIRTSSVLMRRSAVPPGLFPERIMYEDWDVWLRVALASPIGYIDEVLTSYRIYSTSTSHDRLRMQRGAVAMFDRFAADPLPRDIRHLVLVERRRAIADLAHLEYDSGNYGRARALFARLLPAMDAAALARFAVTLLPKRLAVAARRLRHADLHGCVGSTSTTLRL